MRFRLARLNAPAAKRWVALVGFGVLLLLVLNPELLSGILLVDMIGIDVFVLLLVIQFRQHWAAFDTWVLHLLCSRIRSLFTGG